MVNCLVSVIVITYNQEKYIEKCLNSILLQKFDGTIEVLVGDDASTDSTSTIVKKYSELYPSIIKPVIRKQNVGATKNILDLIGRANGKYLAFCEGDDYWVSSEKLELQTKFMSTREDIVGCVHNVLVLDENERALITQNVSWISSDAINILDSFDGILLPGHLSTLLVRKIDFTKFRYLDVLFVDRNLSDRMLFLLFATIGDIVRLSETLSVYRYMRSLASGNVTATINFIDKTNCKKDMHIYNSMELWLEQECGIQKHFISAQSRVLVTALFHQIKGYDVSFYEVWNMCSHKYLALARFPIAFVEQFVQKIKVMFGFELR